MTTNEFYGVFMPIVEYYKADLSPAVIALYFEDLGHLEASELKRGLRELRQSRKYSNMPTIAEILEAVEGDFESKAQLALDELIYAINKYGTDRSVCFSNKAIMSVVNAAGGWEAVGNLEGKEWEDFKKWEFKKLYKTYSKPNQTAPAYLVGKHERKNSFNGQTNKFDKIYFIGEDKEPMSLIEFKQGRAAAIQNRPSVSGLLARINKAAV
nr:DUF6475 domain-containing protein [uncultured Campylobacter sp.]